MLNRQVVQLIQSALDKIERDNDWMMFDECVLGIEENRHEKQLEFLRRSISRENVCHAGNGFGKTDIPVKKHIRFLLKHIIEGTKYKTCHTALTLDQASEFVDRFESIVTASPVLRDWFLDRIGSRGQKPTIKIYNGLKIEVRTLKNKAQAIEGKEYGYISADEVAMETHLEFIREKVFLPRLRKWEDSQLDFFATPKGMNAYYRVVNAIKRSGGYVVAGSPYDNPYIDHSIWKHLEKQWPKQKVDQVIYGQFVDNAKLLFASRVEKVFDSALDLEDTMRNGFEYFDAWDLARGKNVNEDDLTVGLRFVKTKKGKYRIVKHWAYQLPWTKKSRESLAKKGERFDSSLEEEIRRAWNDHKQWVLLDKTGIGDPLFEVLSDIAGGVDFRGNKEKLIEHAQLVIDYGLVESPLIPKLVDQMTVYTLDEDKKLDTDYLMAFIIGCSNIQIPSQKVKMYSRNEIGL